MAENAGGTLDCFFFAFGEDDVVAIIDLPGNQSAAAVAMTIAATGLVSIKTTVLLTPEEVDGAAKVSVGYRGPGQ